MEENMQGESSMDEKAFLLQEIRYSKRKQNVKKFLRYESTGIAAGGDDTAAVQQKNLTVGHCGCSDRQFFYAGAGKSFAKEL